MAAIDLDSNISDCVFQEYRHGDLFVLCTVWRRPRSTDQPTGMVTWCACDCGLMVLILCYTI